MRNTKQSDSIQFVYFKMSKDNGGTTLNADTESNRHKTLPLQLKVKCFKSVKDEAEAVYKRLVD